MSLRRPPAHLTLILLLAVMASAGRARAICTANEILNNPQEPGCTAAMIPCTITKSYTIDNGCTLDFGTHTVTSNGNLSFGAGTAAIRAASLTLVGAINGIGGVNDPRGGMITITTTGGFVVALGGGINVSGNNHGGDVIVRAGGSVSILGKIQADFLRKEAAGGLIDISADGDITTGPGPTSVLSAQGGNDSDGGGEIDLTADGAMTLLTTLDVDGLDGGFLELDAGGKLVMQGADASGAGDAGSGGCIDVVAGASAEVHGAIIAKGASGTFMTGGCGGLICFDGGRGDITIANGAVVNADGASPDGGGGQITLLAQGSAFLNGQVQARGPDGETCGGDLCVETGFDVTVASLGPVDVLDAGGGDSGGEIELVAGRNMMINGQIDCSGRATGSIGGDVTLRAGQIGSGSLTLTSAIDVRSNAPCGVENGCGQGGSTDLRGCNVTVSPTGALLATGPDGGENDLTASEQITVQGTMDATHTVAGHDDGSNRFIFRPTKFPITQGNGIKPDFLTLTVTTCPELGETVPPCLTPCPVCGDGRVDFPETCDLGIIPPHSCSGCSAYCRLENCDDGLFCSLDSCDIMFGCDHEGIPGCTEPTPTVTNTRPTSTATPTVTSTPSMTATPTVTSTALPSNTPSVTPTTSATSTASPSSTSSATTTATAIPTATNVVVDTPSPTASATVASTATVMATATATVTASATATATATSSPAATNTVPPACAGDCSGNGEVTVNELIVGVNIALGNTGTDACPAFDRNADGMVSISELIAAVNAALNGC